MGHAKNWISLLADTMTTNHKGKKIYDRVNLRNTHIETEIETERRIAIIVPQKRLKLVSME